MRRLSLILLAAAGLACSHVTTAKEQPASKPAPRPVPQPATEENRPAAASAPKHRPNTSGTSARPGTEREAAAPGRPQLATSPEGLMLPEGPELIQEALSRRGYLPDHKTSRTLDEKTTGALQRFQADNGLPGTGAPDRETVRRLGLSPSKVFRNPAQASPDAR